MHLIQDPVEIDCPVPTEQCPGFVGAGGLGFSADGWICAATCTNQRYTISVAVDNTATPPTFAITGAPTALQVADGTLTYNNVGQKTRMVSGVDKGW